MPIRTNETEVSQAMGMNLVAFACPNCGQTMSTEIGPNWTAVRAPTASGWTVVVLTCRECNQIIGTYTFRSE